MQRKNNQQYFSSENRRHCGSSERSWQKRGKENRHDFNLSDQVGRRKSYQVAHFYLPWELFKPFHLPRSNLLDQSTTKNLFVVRMNNKIEALAKGGGGGSRCNSRTCVGSSFSLLIRNCLLSIYIDYGMISYSGYPMINTFSSVANDQFQEKHSNLGNPGSGVI